MPHVFSRLDPETKAIYKKQYKKFKRSGSVLVLGTVGVADGKRLAVHILSSKLKANGYKSFFAITLGPFIQFGSLPLYIFSYGSKIRKLALFVT